MPWARRRYRGNKVWIETDDAGAYAIGERGLLRMRYKPEDDRTYSVREAEVFDVDAEAAAGADPAKGPRPPARPPARSQARSQGRRRPAAAKDDRPAAGSAEPAPADHAAEAPSDGTAEDAFEPGDDVPALAGLALHAYTDGASSGNPGPAGLGVVLLFREHRKEISRYLGETTNNVAELTAVLDALRAIKRRDLPVRVHVDSSYTIGVLDGSMRPKANVALVEEIRGEMRGFHDLAFVKVAGHAGVEWNERADALARDAIRKGRPKAR